MKPNKTWFYAILFTLMGIVFSNNLKSQTYTVTPDAEDWTCGLDSAWLDGIVRDTGFVNKMARYNSGLGTTASGPYIVPVVFHVVSTSSATAVLPYAAIQWQMARINAAFQNQMTQFNGQPSGSRAVNTQIEFRLACKAQNCGNVFSNVNEPGVMRYATTNTLVLNQGVAPSPTTTNPLLAITHPSTCTPVFPFANYLNIWCVPSLPTSPTGTVNAYGTFPWMTAGIDGIVTRIDIVGNNSYPTNFSLNPLSNKGSILAHEVGHYLGLYHTFQAQIGGCTLTPTLLSTYTCSGTSSVTANCEGDLVYDTPPTFIHSDLGSMASINSCHENYAPYGGTQLDQPDQLENYMSYSDDDKLNTFTTGQAIRMQSAFTNTAYPTRINLNSASNFTVTGIVPQTCSLTANILTGIFNYSLAAGSTCTTTNVQFTNPLSVGFSTVGTTYSWNFGDATTGSTPNPLHTYSTAGGTLYAVSCTVTTGTATATYSQNISINYNNSIVGQTGPNVCRGTEQTIYIAFSQGVPSVQLTDGVNPPITVYNAMGTFPHTQPYTFPINASATYSLMPVGCNTTTATFNVTDCCNTLVTNGDFEAGYSGYLTQLTTPFFPGPYPYFGTYEIYNPAIPTSLTNGIHNATGNAMNIDGFCGKSPSLTYTIVQGCPATTIPSSITPRPIVWQQTVSGLTAGLNYYYSFKFTENYNSGSGSCVLNFATSIYNTTLTPLPTQTLAPIRFLGSTGNPTPYLDFVVYTYTFTAPPGTTPATTFSVEINQINNFYGTGWDYALDNITLNAMTPSMQAIGNKTICPTQTATLNAVAACNTSTANFAYVWTPSTGLTNPNIINPVASPTTTTIYTLVATPTATGIPASITTVTVTVLPTFTITPYTQIIYAGSSATITAGGSTGSYTWNPGPIVSNSIVVTPSVTTIYTVTNAATGTCTANNTATVIVSAACSTTANATIGTSSVSTTTVTAGTYTLTNQVIDMQGTIVFNGNTTIVGYTLRMAPGARIFVTNKATLTLDNCRLFGCTQLWNGIEVDATPANYNSNLSVIHGTTIEDMYNGIYRNATYTIATSGQGAILIQDSKLNKNYIGVQLSNFPAVTPAGDSYSLTVRNSTLTTVSSTTSPGNNLKPGTAFSYTYAYNQIPSGAGGGSATYTNFPRSFIGININNMNVTNNVLIGDSVTPNTFNTFSNLDIGINVVNANARVHNNSFVNMKGSNKHQSQNPFDPIAAGPPEIGVCVVATNTVANTYSLQVGTKNGVPIIASQSYQKSNTFKTIYKGISATNCKVVIAKGNFFDSDTTDYVYAGAELPFVPNTYYYYKNINAIWSSGLGTRANITQNMIKNYANGIFSSHTMSVTSGSSILMQQNNIQVFAAMGYCKQAIQIQQVGGASMASNLLEVYLNSMSKVYNGIKVTSVNGGLYIHDNTAFQLDGVKTLGYTNATFQRRGIDVSSCSNGVIAKNSINTTAIVSGTNYSYFTGFYMNISPTNTVTCNSVDNFGRGFLFQGNCTNANSWLGNGISNSYQGLCLVASGVMGIQGTTPSGTLAANTWSNVTQETFVSGTSNANTASYMYVAPNSGSPKTSPTLNFSVAPSSNYITGISDGIREVSGTAFSCGGGGCGGCLMGGMSSSSMSSSGTANPNDAMFASLATSTNSVYPQYADEHIFKTQQLVYSLQKQGLVAKNASNPTLQSFYNANTNSNIGKFTDVDDAVANNQKALAQIKNNSISPANTVQQKTKRANELMLKLTINPNYTFSGSELQDLISMANECSVKGGYVALSRNIINVLTGTLAIYDDVCEDTKVGSRIGNTEESNNSIADVKRTFNLFPNPNNGNMTMNYDLGKDDNGTMNLFDVTGKLINSYDLLTANGSIEINEAQLKNGIYFYRILVKGIIVNTNKVVIIK